MGVSCIACISHSHFPLNTPPLTDVILAAQLKNGQEQRAAAPTTMGSYASEAAALSAPSDLLVPAPSEYMCDILLSKIFDLYPITKTWWDLSPEPLKQKRRALAKALRKNVCKLAWQQVSSSCMRVVWSGWLTD